MARLRYYPDSRPGIARRRCGRGFTYLAPDGTRIDNRAKRQEIEALAVPPAYDDVWISPLRNGHLRATGRDTRARKQYMYHPEWTARQEAEKFDRLVHLGDALPRLRGWIARRLTGKVGDFETAMAAGLALADRLSMRVGDPAYAEENGSYGITTLEPGHLASKGSVSRLAFTAKGGREVELALGGTRLEQVLRDMAALSGPALISWIDEGGERRPIRAAQLNKCLSEICGEGHTIKSLRTWNGTHAAWLVAQTVDRPTISAMADKAAERLHNTPTVARNSYIHPAVLDAGREGWLPRDNGGQTRRGLRRGEAGLLRFLRLEEADTSVAQ